MRATARARFLSLGFALLLGGCAGLDPGGQRGPEAAAPELHVGDRWVYRVREGFRDPMIWQETHEVTAIGSQGITVRVSAEGERVHGQRIEEWAAPGVVRSGAVFENETRRFQPPVVRYAFPLRMGETWSQRVIDLDHPPGPYGPIIRYVRVGGYERVSTPAGTFDAIRLRVFQRLDDETFWRWPTECTYLVWYAPAVGASVREEREAQYLEKGDALDGVAVFRSQHALVELVSFSKGGERPK